MIGPLNGRYPRPGPVTTAASAPSPSRSKQRDFPAGFPRGSREIIWSAAACRRFRAGKPVESGSKLPHSKVCNDRPSCSLRWVRAGAARLRCVSPWPAARTVCHDRRGSLTIRWQVTQVPAHSVSQETMCVGQPSKCGSGNTPQKFHWSTRTKMNPYGQDRSRGDAPGGASTRALGIVTQTGAAAASRDAGAARK